MTLQRDMNDMIEPIDKQEPIDNSDPADAMEPADRTEPTEATDNAEPLEPIDNTESSDHRDHLELSPARRIHRILRLTTRRGGPRRRQAFLRSLASPTNAKSNSAGVVAQHPLRVGLPTGGIAT